MDIKQTLDSMTKIATLQHNISMLLELKRHMDEIIRIDKETGLTSPDNTSTCPRIPATDETYGYRWVRKPSTDAVYIVKIKIDSDYWHDPESSNLLDFVTEYCTIVEIYNVITRKNVSKVNNAIAYFQNNVNYQIGQKIENDKTWFCLSENDLILSQGNKINMLCGKIMFSNPCEYEGD